MTFLISWDHLHLFSLLYHQYTELYTSKVVEVNAKSMPRWFAFLATKVTLLCDTQHAQEKFLEI